MKTRLVSLALLSILYVGALVEVNFDIWVIKSLKNCFIEFLA